MIDAIDEFWAWWAGAGEELAATINAKEPLNEHQIEAISEHVHAIHESLAWEMGPGEQSQHHFALSPEGDPELRVVTQRWLARAPKPSANWEYYAARQGTGHDPATTLTLNDRSFAFADFRLALEIDEHHAVVHVEAFHPLFTELPEEERGFPTFLFLDNTLGEDIVTSWIGSVDTRVDLPEDAKPPEELVAAVSQVRESWDPDTISLVQGEIEGTPVFALVKLQLKRLDHLLHDYHWQLVLALQDADDRGLPPSAESDELNELEDGLLEALGPRAIWIGHETYAGTRRVHFHADSTSITQDEVLQYCTVHGHWQAELIVTHDPAWEILQRY